MKKRIGVIILVLACLGLGIALIATTKNAKKAQLEQQYQVAALSNSIEAEKIKINDFVQKSAHDEKDLADTKSALTDLTNRFTQISANLSQTSSELAKSEAAIKARDEEIKKRDAKITDLENQNQALDKRALELGASITNLSAQIDDTRKRLASSEGDKAVLEANLKRLIAEKAELERQFNDITVLRTQVSKLRQELTIARRLDWIRAGLFASTEQKGAQKLLDGINPLRVFAKPARPNYDLNVEVSSDGSVKVIPPPTTNAPPPTSPPPK